MILTLILISMRRYPENVSLVSTCSAAICAACHQPLPDDGNAYMFPVFWGEVSEDNRDVRNCCFTTARDAKPPTPGKLYN